MLTSPDYEKTHTEKLSDMHNTSVPSITTLNDEIIAEATLYALKNSSSTTTGFELFKLLLKRSHYLLLGYLYFNICGYFIGKHFIAHQNYDLVGWQSFFFHPSIIIIITFILVTFFLKPLRNHPSTLFQKAILKKFKINFYSSKSDTVKKLMAAKICLNDNSIIKKAYPFAHTAFMNNLENINILKQDGLSIEKLRKEVLNDCFSVFTISKDSLTFKTLDKVSVSKEDVRKAILDTYLKK